MPRSILIDMRKSIDRSRKYAAKLQGNVAAARAEADGDRQQTAFGVSSGDQVGVERLTKSVLTAAGVMPGLNHFYMNFAKKIHKDKGMYSGGTLTTEVCAERDHWTLRGLSVTVLDDIIERMGLSSCEVPAPVCAWDWKRKLTFSGNVATTNLDDFPVLVHLTVANFDFNKAQALGQDIRFMDSDTCPSDGVPLKHEIENWDKPGNNAWVWVKVPRIDANSAVDFIYMFYGNGVVADGQDAPNVWNPAYEEVWHMYDNPNVSTVTGSTINAYVGNKAGPNNPNEVGAKIWNGQDFNGSSSNISQSAVPFRNIANGTIEFWANWDIPQGSRLLRWWFDGNNYVDIESVQVGGVQPLRVILRNGGPKNDISTVPLMNPGTWYHVAFTWGANFARIYINGVLRANDAVVSGTAGNLNTATLGSPAWFNGKMDCHRVSTAQRTVDWLMASYKSGDETLITYGPEE